MRKKLPPGVKYSSATRADGTVKTYYFHRATKTRLPDDPDSPEFKRLLERLNREVEAEKTRAPQKTVATLIRDYCRSQDWLGLAASTRTIEAYNLKAIEDEFGEMALEAVEERGARKLFLEWRDELAVKTPRAADAKLARLARVLAFGLDREEITVNPLATFKRVYDGDRSEIIWLPHHIEAFNAVAHPSLQLALVMGLHTGQRKSDLLSLTWDQYDGTAIHLVQGKTKKEVYIPCTEALKVTLDNLSHPHPQILTNVRGRPWTVTGFDSVWERAFERAGIAEDLHFHDLRGTAVTMLAEAGCTVPEIATITGHTLESVNKILERYLSRTRQLAHSAIAKLEQRMKR